MYTSAKLTSLGLKAYQDIKEMSRKEARLVLSAAPLPSTLPVGNAIPLQGSGAPLIYGCPPDSWRLMHGSSRSQLSRTPGLMEATPAPNPVAWSSPVCVGRALTKALSARVRAGLSTREGMGIPGHSFSTSSLPFPAPWDLLLPKDCGTERRKGHNHVPVITKPFGCASFYS